MSTQSNDEAVGRIIEIADLVADQHDVDADAALTEALGRVRKRGGSDE